MAVVCSRASITYIQNHTITKINESFAVLAALDQLPESVISTHESSPRNRLSAIAKAHHHRSAKYSSQATTKKKQRAGRLRQMQFIMLRLSKMFGIDQTVGSVCNRVWDTIDGIQLQDSEIFSVV